MPMTIISIRPTAPLRTGSLRKGNLSEIEMNGVFCMTISPDARRTAVATIPLARIITPSMTACPPTGITFSSRVRTPTPQFSTKYEKAISVSISGERCFRRYVPGGTPREQSLHRRDFRSFEEPQPAKAGDKEEDKERTPEE